MSRSLSPRWIHRLSLHHLPVGLVSFGLVWGIQSAIDSTHWPYRWSMATAYAGMLLLAATLTTGTINVLGRRPNPVSSDLRRDLGIWCAIVSVAHVLVGLQVHMKSMWLYFVKAVDGPDAWSPRGDAFGFANYTGLVAALIVLLLLALSNDASMRWLGTGRWKSVQRWNYALLVLVAVHGAVFQMVEKRGGSWRVVFWSLVGLIVLLQIAGIMRRLAPPERRQIPRL